MHPADIDIICPICEHKIRLNRLGRHANRAHGDICKEDFEKMVLQRYSDGTLEFDTRRVVPPGRMRTGSQAILEAGRKGKKMVKKVSGGAVELGKRK